MKVINKHLCCVRKGLLLRLLYSYFDCDAASSRLVSLLLSHLGLELLFIACDHFCLLLLICVLAALRSAIAIAERRPRYLAQLKARDCFLGYSDEKIAELLDKGNWWPNR